MAKSPDLVERRGFLVLRRYPPIEFTGLLGRGNATLRSIAPSPRKRKMQPPPSSVHVIIADDHPLVRAGVRSLLATLPEVIVLAEAANGKELLELLESVQPDIVITDISMPHTDGLQALREIRARHPDVRVVIFSMHDDPAMVKQAISAGAAAYLRKDSSEFELASALTSVMTTGAYISAAVARLLVEPEAPSLQEALTQRQIQILTMLAQGQSSKQIGYALDLSPKTVDVHRARIMHRLGVRDLPGLVLFAVRKGLVKP
jgi:two-component system, NarL family, nitrate/nitrite response regulator NarL